MPPHATPAANHACRPPPDARPRDTSPPLAAGRGRSSFAGRRRRLTNLAKLIIKFINNLASVIDADPAMRGPA